METKVLIGTLADLKKVRTDEGISKVAGFQDRAMWSWLRLQCGRRKIDQEIKKAAEQMKVKEYTPALEKLILTHLDEQRQLQYIVADGHIKAVATLKHLLIPPEQVEKVAMEILGSSNIAVEEDPDLKGLVSATDEYAGIRLGFHVYPGDIMTRRAISVSSYLKTIQCLNAITFVGIGNFSRFGLERTHERILRIHKITELRPRLETAINEATKNIEDLKNMIKYAKQKNVDPREAKVILSAFSKSYGLGHRVIKELLGRLSQEDATTYGMSQAASYTARHSESFRKTPEDKVSHARQSMAVVGAASLLVEDPKATYEQAKKWLKGKPKWPEWLTP